MFLISLSSHRIIEDDKMEIKVEKEMGTLEEGVKIVAAASTMGCGEYY